MQTIDLTGPQRLELLMALQQRLEKLDEYAETFDQQGIDSISVKADRRIVLDLLDMFQTETV